MDDQRRQFFATILIGEIKFHIESAKKAYSEYLYNRRERRVEDVFRYLHSFLTHCVLICNLLLPINERVEYIEDEDKREKIKEANKRKAYRKALLKQYIKKGGLLDPLRAIRNRFEHYDEDLDEWIATTKHTIYMTRNIFDNATLSGAIKIGGIQAERLEEEIRPFAYIENNILKYWGKQYDIEKAYDALLKLEQEVKQLNLRNRSI